MPLHGIVVPQSHDAVPQLYLLPQALQPQVPRRMLLHLRRHLPQRLQQEPGPAARSAPARPPLAPIWPPAGVEVGMGL
jgi:hypothetical protein